MPDNTKWTELVALLEEGLEALPASDWLPELYMESSVEAKIDVLGRLELSEAEALSAAIDNWLDTQAWQSPLSPKQIYCPRNRFFVSFYYARHIPSMPPKTAYSDTIIPFPELPLVEVCRWYLIQWYETHGMFLLAEGHLPENFDYGRN
jgi:hypothetical protein